MFEYWHKQEPNKPLFPDIEWQKPEHKSRAGNLAIIGGTAHGFAAVAQAYSDAQQAGIGECRVILPDVLKQPVGALAKDAIFVPTTLSGGISKDSLAQLQATINWANGLLFIGDAGRNSESAITYEQLLIATTTINIITRDAVDLLQSAWPQLLQQENNIFIVTFAQLQKMFQNVYYPKNLLFRMQLTALVEVLHKFTITYPATIVVFHQGTLLVATDGKISSTPWHNPMLIWRGSVAAKCATYAIQHPKFIFKAITSALA